MMTTSHINKKRRLRSDRNSSSLSSADIIGHNHDLLTKLFLLLPAKSLVRFKLVNEQWRSLISDESFHRRHLLNHHLETQHSFILGVQGRSQYFICHPTIRKLVRFSFPCDFPFIDEYVKIMQSCHGLLLLECRYSERSSTAHYFVLNPTTKQFRDIHRGSSAVALSLFFNPSKSEYYKVIGIWKDESRPNAGGYCLSEYASDTQEWTARVPSFPLNGHKFKNILSGNTCVYFLRNKNTSFYYSADEGHLHTAPCPPGKYVKSRYLTESNGHLHCLNISFSISIHTPSPWFSIAEMVDNEWTDGKKIVWKQMTRKLKDQKRSTRGQAEFLGMIREERIEDSVFFVHVPGQIIISRLRDEVCDVLVDYRSDYFYQEGRLQFEFKDAHPFIESFAAV